VGREGEFPEAGYEEADGGVEAFPPAFSRADGVDDLCVGVVADEVALHAGTGKVDLRAEVGEDLVEVERRPLA
jgi:hypothetical protein